MTNRDDYGNILMWPKTRPDHWLTKTMIRVFALDSKIGPNMPNRTIWFLFAVMALARYLSRWHRLKAQLRRGLGIYD